MKGHVEIRPASGDQFKVLFIGSNGEITQISERLTSHQNCLINILSIMNTVNGSYTEVRDYTEDPNKDGFSPYWLYHDGARTYGKNPWTGEGIAPDEIPEPEE